MDRNLTILLVEDNPSDAGLLREVLGEIPGQPFGLQHEEALASALGRLSGGGIDLVILDLNLPDSAGLDTLARVRAQAEDVPVVVLTGTDDEERAVEAVHMGAQDYLVKGQVTAALLKRSIRYAVERQRMQAELQSLSLVDELTGLSNRRGFRLLGERQVNLSARTRRLLALVFIDVDGMKTINDTHGHKAGDAALQGVAKVLRRTFRETDIIARIGGDEFAVLAVEMRGAAPENFEERLRTNVESFNRKENRPFTLSISIGIARHDPDAPRSFDDLLAEADRKMYFEKQGKPRR
jgi:two-component system, cell cycle response regulator